MGKPKISVIGVGYVGLCTAVGFASKGYNVVACDVVPEKIEKICAGIAPFYEPGLDDMLKETIQNGNLKCLINETQKAVLDTNITYIAVGTPSNDDGSIDLQYIEVAAHDIGTALRQKGQ